MRSLAVAAVLFGVLGVAGTAHAQFQNHSIGLEVGYLKLDPTMGYSDAALPPAFAVDATIYMEAGFDVGLRFAFAIQTTPRGAPSSESTQGVVLYPAAMLRYFLWQDFFRPYVGLSLEFMHAFDSQATSANFVGLGPTVGFEYFFAEDWSVGLNGEFAGYFALNVGAHYTAQVWARVATHF